MKQIEHVVSWLRESNHSFVFSGAGISTESGIPDFRSPGGIWSKYQPVYFDEFLASVDARREYWRQKCEAHREFSDAQPNPGHRVIADWEQRGLVDGVITQNIDELHQLAGNSNVIELHGTARKAQCMTCGVRHPIQPYVDAFLASREPPICEDCGGPMKHATISFGQALDDQVVEQAHCWMQAADLVMALGSSLVVQPAAGLPLVAKQHGARLVIINRDATPLDDMADLVIHQALGKTLAMINAAL